MSNWNSSDTTCVISVYRPKEGQSLQLNEIVRRHVPTLREEGLITDRPTTALLAADDTVVEIFEWSSLEAVEQAHTNPRVQEIWTQIAEVAEITTLSTLAEANRPFSPFRPLI
jgi:hypothetical protein